jgi:hypothetical protein
MTATETNLPTTEEGIDGFLAAFEDGSLPKERWTHTAHLLGGACCVHRLGESAALDHMRDCVKRYNLAVGGQNTETAGYHETVTVFWIKMLAALLVKHPGVSRAEFAALAVKKFAEQRELLQSYYDFDVVGSRAARARWVEPTVMRLG